MIPVPCNDVNRANIDPSKKRAASFIERIEGADYIVIDEMSMVGRRALGQIDYLLTHAKGDSKQTFGGLSIILVGDHGQLPPVKDKRPYDVSGVRNARTGQALVSAPKWELRGVQRYSEFHDVFFLDKIERIAKGNGDAAETTKLDAFRDLQLRARDGVLERSDHENMRRTMDLAGMLEGRKAEFFAPDVYSLVTTRKKRDQHNFDATTALLNAGSPGIVLKAIHSPENSPAAVAEDDDVGLAKQLLLARGSRVMVTWNITVPHGLVNGTVGTVVDVLVQDGLATSVLVAVRRAGDGKNGYCDPSFTSAEKYDLDTSDYAIVAIGRKTVKIHENKMDSQRSQFPLMLAHAVTIHKAQGLTLERVRIDAGDDERAVGLFFVALTRVRHPDHIAFDPMPDRVRVTTNIATKPALRKRKAHERELRGMAAQTKEKYASCSPPPDEPPAAPAAGSSSTTIHDGDSSDDEEVPDLHGPGADADQPGDPAAFHMAVFNHHLHLLGNIGLERVFDQFPDEATSWIDTANELFTMKARIIDYHGNGKSERFAKFLRFLGFDGAYECNAQQVGSSCGVVAARIVMLLQIAAHVDRVDWFELDTTSAVDGAHILEANRLIETDVQRHTPTFTRFLTNKKNQPPVSALARCWSTATPSGEPQHMRVLRVTGAFC